MAGAPTQISTDINAKLQMRHSILILELVAIALI